MNFTIKPIEQNTDNWMDYRHGRITGSKAKTLKTDTYTAVGLKTLENKYAKTPTPELEQQIKQLKDKQQAYKYTAGIWELLAEQLTDNTTNTEDARERGHRLENTNATLVTIKKQLSNITLTPGVWEQSDTLLSVSPDACENTDRPTWAIECKSFNSSNHLKVVIPWLVITKQLTLPDDIKTRLMFNELESARAFDHIPDEYKTQILQYFIVNPYLNTVYFSLYDDRIKVEKLQHCIITVTRASISNEIEEQTEKLNTISNIVNTIKSIVEEE